MHKRASMPAFTPQPKPGNLSHHSLSTLLYAMRSLPQSCILEGVLSTNLSFLALVPPIVSFVLAYRGLQLRLDRRQPLRHHGHRLRQHARRDGLAHDPARRGVHVNVLAVDVVPRAAGEDGDVVGEVEDGGDEGEAEEEEDDGVYRWSVRLQHSDKTSGVASYSEAVRGRKYTGEGGGRTYRRQTSPRE